MLQYRLLDGVCGVPPRGWFTKSRTIGDLALADRDGDRRDKLHRSHRPPHGSPARAVAPAESPTVRGRIRHWLGAARGVHTTGTGVNASADDSLLGSRAGAHRSDGAARPACPVCLSIGPGHPPANPPQLLRPDWPVVPAPVGQTCRAATTTPAPRPASPGTEELSVALLATEISPAVTAMTCGWPGGGRGRTPAPGSRATPLAPGPTGKTPGWQGRSRSGVLLQVHAPHPNLRRSRPAAPRAES